jgi:hypothetical protein
MQSLGTIREFNTRNFRVIVDAVEEDLPSDLSWDESGEVAEKLDSGEFIRFCARARVIFKPTSTELGADYLGDCIYRSLEEFADHRQAAKQQRKLRAKGSDALVGSYFADMIAQAIAEARKEFATLKKQTRSVRLRKTA